MPYFSKMNLKIHFIIITAASFLLLTSCSVIDNYQVYPDSETPGNGSETENVHDKEETNDNLAKSEAPGGPGKSEEDNDPGQPDENSLAEPETVPKVALYSGSGSWEENVDSLKEFFTSYELEYDLVDEIAVTEPSLAEHYEIVVFPGGGAADYRYEISDHDNIRSFVEAGGQFIGLCAGAYYAADIFRWQDTSYEYPLGIFEGSSIGPLTGQVGWGDKALLNLKPDHPANDNFADKLNISYYDGPYFMPHNFNGDSNQAIEILARYDVNDQPAVIAGRFGEGSYLLFGPHPEMDFYGTDEGANWPWLYSSLLWFANW